MKGQIRRIPFKRANSGGINIFFSLERIPFEKDQVRSEDEKTASKLGGLFKESYGCWVIRLILCFSPLKAFGGCIRGDSENGQGIYNSSTENKSQ
jgi:hypothetical protein